MRALDLARKPHGEMIVDVCADCRALWFDAYESVQLTPAATIALFREVQQAVSPARRAMPEHMQCPRCRATLADTQDLRHATRFGYWRCTRGHGRFTPFVQFLREKDFVRPLAFAELERLKAHVRTIRCSGCGAPVELARDMVCRYCRAPIEALDPKAVGDTVRALEAAEMRRTPLDLDGLADAMLGHRDRPLWRSRFRADAALGKGTIDLIGSGIDILLDAIDRD